MNRWPTASERGELNWTSEAQRWLEDIFEYVAQENPFAAGQVVEGIYNRAQTLKDFPESGYCYEPSGRNVRILLFGHYRIAYLIRDDGNVVVLGVFHGSSILGDTTCETHDMRLKSFATLIRIKHLRLNCDSTIQSSPLCRLTGC